MQTEIEFRPKKNRRICTKQQAGNPKCWWPHVMSKHWGSFKKKKRKTGPPLGWQGEEGNKGPETIWGCVAVKKTNLIPGQRGRRYRLATGQSKEILVGKKGAWSNEQEPVTTERGGVRVGSSIFGNGQGNTIPHVNGSSGGKSDKKCHVRLTRFLGCGSCVCAEKGMPQNPKRG